MNTTIKNYSSIVSSVLILPALVLCLAGLGYVALGIQAANDFLGALMNNPWTKILFSPVVVFGGLLLSLALNACQVCRVRIAQEERGWVFSLCLARMFGPAAFAGMAALLSCLLLAYAFVENFRIIAR